MPDETTRDLRDRFHVTVGTERVYMPAWKHGEPDRSKRPNLAAASELHRWAREHVETFSKTWREIQADERLSPVGRAEKLRELARGEHQAGLAALRAKALRPLREKLAKARSELRPVHPRAGDDLAGTLGDMEVRTYLRGLEPEQRQAAVLADPALAEAVLRGASPQLSGLTPATTKLLESRLLQGRHGPELEALEEEEEAAQVAEQALEVAESAIRKLSGMSRVEAGKVEAGELPAGLEGVAPPGPNAAEHPADRIAREAVEQYLGKGKPA